MTATHRWGHWGWKLDYSICFFLYLHNLACNAQSWPMVLIKGFDQTESTASLYLFTDNYSTYCENVQILKNPTYNISTWICNGVLSSEHDCLTVCILPLNSAHAVLTSADNCLQLIEPTLYVFVWGTRLWVNYTNHPVALLPVLFRIWPEWSQVSLIILSWPFW